MTNPEANAKHSAPDALSPRLPSVPITTSSLAAGTSSTTAQTSSAAEEVSYVIAYACSVIEEDSSAVEEVSSAVAKASSAAEETSSIVEQASSIVEETSSAAKETSSMAEEPRKTLQNPGLDTQTAFFAGFGPPRAPRPIGPTCRAASSPHHRILSLAPVRERAGVRGHLRLSTFNSQLPLTNG